MKRIVLLALIAVLSLTALSFAGYVNGYTRSDGTYVSGYYRSDADSTVRNNYGYEGNVNPYTGAIGHNRYRNSPSSEYFGE
jgi:hypothetical protein